MSIAERELVITRLIAASPDEVYKAYTTPDILEKWWMPKPYSLKDCFIEPYAGGAFNSTMVDPEGKETPMQGIVLEAVPGKRFAFSDAFEGGWIPKPDPFMAAVIDFTEEGGKTLITATVRHWTVEAKKQHEEMGFHTGWGQVLDQLAELLEG